MSAPKRVPLPGLLLGVFLLWMAAALPAGARAPLQADSPQALIDAVNHLRQVNGLEAYQVNAALMQAAQQQADWQAAQGTVTHTGQGGTRPKDRAAAAGYGGGAAIFVSENIAGGYRMSAADAVSMWQGDDPHLNTMLGANYREVGAGVAAAGDTVYYVLLAGYVAGGAPASTIPAATVTPNTGGGQSTGAEIVTSTPAADGSVKHVVQPGDSLWGIAVAYKVSIAQLMSLNGLTANAVLYPGQTIIIHRAGEITPVPTDTPAPPTPTPTPTGPRLPTATPAWMGPPGTVVITIPPPPTPAPPPKTPADETASRQRVAIGIGLGALALIALLEWRGRRG